MQGEPCWIGVDLSSKIDLTAVVIAFPPTETRKTWRLMVYCLTPEDTLVARARRDRAPYAAWVTKGWLRTNPGNRIDQDVVLGIIKTAATICDVQGVGIDPWNAGNLVTDLEAEGFYVVEVPQTRPQLSATAKEFEADVLEGLVDAGANELMTWAISNVVARPDDNDTILPSKKRSRGRIDPVMAALNARKLASVAAAPAEDPELVTA
jgi:phage terminase large subunit-like protein